MNILSNPWVKAFLVSLVALAVANRVGFIYNIVYPTAKG